MENQADNAQDEKSGPGFKSFATKRIILSAVLIVAVVWAFGIGLKSIGRPGRTPTESQTQSAQVTQEAMEHQVPPAATVSPGPYADQSEVPDSSQHVAAGPQPEKAQDTAPDTDKSSPPAATADVESHGAGEPLKSEAALPQGQAPKADTQDEAVPHAQQAETETQHAVRPKGVAFVEAVIQPIDYELNKRFWGWRPNDVVNFTDNTNNFQLGVLEVTRRTAIMLSDRISRTGSTDRLNPHLEDAANWLMVTATRYWFPSPESKYQECIKELETYKQELIKGTASFYIRADNLIPLLASYEDLLGSCDENLVKQKNQDGSDVGFFQADDYFFYAKGVASAMATILEAIHHDFQPTLENRHGAELLHHALMSCRQASALAPLLITNTDLDGILANHRANMAAPISHARFYIGQLIKTLST